MKTFRLPQGQQLDWIQEVPKREIRRQWESVLITGEIEWNSEVIGEDGEELIYIKLE
jgi:hypothetical protein